MDETKTKWWIAPLVRFVRDRGIKACEAKAQQLVAEMIRSDRSYRPSGINVGGGVGTRWPKIRSLDSMLDRSLDFNTERLPVAEASFDYAVCEQVIEHLHNTTWFLSELSRIIRPGGDLFISTENLGSFPNLFALLMGKAPFSTQAVCGRFLGGWKNGPAGYKDGVRPNHPAFAGVRGHVRVMTTGQLWALLELAGFQIIRKYGYGGNHYILFHARR